MKKFAGMFLTALLCSAPALADTLTNGTGDGKVSITVGGGGAFGSNAGSLDGGEAYYDPIGATPQGRSTYYSDVYFRIGDSGVRSSLGSSSATVNASSATSLTSTFLNSGISFGLTQTVSNLTAGGVQAGSLLTQTYTFTNTSATTQDFEFVRYIDGDLYFNNSSLDDGGGRLVNGLGQEILFETDGALGTADTDTFLGIFNQGGTPSNYQIQRYQTLQNLIIAGTALNNTVAGDGADADQFIDVGNAYDVTLALGSNFTLAGGASGTFITYTIFGTGTPSDVVIPPPTTPAPEPAAWALMILGFGLAGMRLRKSSTGRNRKVRPALAA
jgi:hypothetical protein